MSGEQAKDEGGWPADWERKKKMNPPFEFLIRVLLSGIGATAVMDLWALLLKRAFGIPSLNFAFLGRWLGHLPEGKWVHESIGKSAPVRGELLLGWCAHYSIGITFSARLISISSVANSRR